MHQFGTDHPNVIAVKLASEHRARYPKLPEDSLVLFLTLILLSGVVGDCGVSGRGFLVSFVSSLPSASYTSSDKQIALSAA